MIVGARQVGLREFVPVSVCLHLYVLCVITSHDPTPPRVAAA